MSNSEMWKVFCHWWPSAGLTVCCLMFKCVYLCVCTRKESKHYFKDKWEWCPFWQKLLSLTQRPSLSAWWWFFCFLKVVWIDSETFSASNAAMRSSRWSTEAGRCLSLDYTHSPSLTQPCQDGGVEAQGHTHTHVVMAAQTLRPARPRLVITLWSPRDSLTGRPRPCDGASVWTWLIPCGRCARSKVPRQHSAPPENVPEPAGRPLAGCWGQTSGVYLCCRVPRAHPRDPWAPREVYA